MPALTKTEKSSCRRAFIKLAMIHLMLNRHRAHGHSAEFHYREAA